MWRRKRAAKLSAGDVVGTSHERDNTQRRHNHSKPPLEKDGIQILTVDVPCMEEGGVVMALGLHVDATNFVRRIDDKSAAALYNVVRVGDVILEVDGINLGGGKAAGGVSMANVIDRTLALHRLVLARRLGHEPPLPTDGAATNGRAAVGGWSSSKPLLRRLSQPAGLVNLGATCYVNSLLQIYFFLPELREEVLRYAPSPRGSVPTRGSRLLAARMRASNGAPGDGVAGGDANHGRAAEAVDGNAGEGADSNRFAEELMLVFARLLLSRRRLVDPSLLLQVLMRGTGFSLDEEADAPEFNKLFISRLEADLEQASTSTRLRRIVYGEQLEKIRFHEAGGEETIQTSRCIFSELIVPVASEKTRELTAALREILRAELPSFRTPRGHLTDAIRELRFVRLPTLLCVHLQRVSYDVEARFAVKCSLPFVFPLVLELSEYCAPTEDVGSAYLLYAMLLHKGDASCGHYQCVLRHESAARGTRWLLFSDASVSEVPASVVLRICKGELDAKTDGVVYCLFYLQRDREAAEAYAAECEAAALPADSFKRRVPCKKAADADLAVEMETELAVEISGLPMALRERVEREDKEAFG